MAPDREKAACGVDPLAQRALASSGAILLTIAALVLLWSVSGVALLFIAGVLLSVALHAPSRWLARRTGMPYGAALAGVMLLLTLAIGGLGFLVAPSLANQFGLFMDRLADAGERISKLAESQRWLQGLANLKLSEVLQNSGSFLAGIRGFFGGVVGFMGGFLVILFVGLFLAAQPGLYVRGVLALVPPNGRKRVGDLLS
jgi:predicted PurR-regulated permease PerM